MSTLKEKLSETIKTAMKAGEKDRLSYARNFHAAIRKKEIDDRIDLDDSGVQKIASTLAKQRQDSIEQFKSGGREDLVQKEEAELAFLLSFLPAQLSDAELLKEIEDAISQTGATTAKDIGKIMKVLLPKVQGKADGKRINECVKQKLGS